MKERKRGTEKKIVKKRQHNQKHRKRGENRTRYVQEFVFPFMKINLFKTPVLPSNVIEVNVM